MQIESYIMVPQGAVFFLVSKSINEFMKLQLQERVDEKNFGNNSKDNYCMMLIRKEGI